LQEITVPFPLVGFRRTTSVIRSRDRFFDHDISLDGVIGIERRSAVTPRAVLQADIFIDGVFGLAHAQILRNLILSCEIS
jgi:hypothetical protein